MPTKQPRLNVVLERPVFRTLERMALRDKVSLSSKARDLIREALELHEDRLLSELATERDATFQRDAAHTHDQVWGHLRR